MRSPPGKVIGTDWVPGLQGCQQDRPHCLGRIGRCLKAAKPRAFCRLCHDRHGASEARICRRANGSVGDRVAHCLQKFVSTRVCILGTDWRLWPRRLTYQEIYCDRTSRVAHLCLASHHGLAMGGPCLASAPNPCMMNRSPSPEEQELSAARIRVVWGQLISSSLQQKSCFNDCVACKYASERGATY